MSRLGVDLSDCCNYLESSKKTERRKRLDELKLLLDNNSSTEFLNKNSETKTGISWQSIFTSLHQCLLKESECYCEESNGKGKILPATDKALRACCGLLIIVVTRANSGQSRLPCKDLFSCILDVCEKAETDGFLLKSIIGETYINLLSLALSTEKYWGEIDFKTWKGLRILCLNLIIKTSSEKMKATIISILNLILLQGGRLSPLIVKSKKLLSVFPDILQGLGSNNFSNLELSALCICHTICVQFGKEFRLSTCSFIDKILPFIISLNDNRTSDTDFKEITAYVLLQMVGIRMTDKNWLQEASSLLNFAEKELSDISKHKLQLPPLPKIVVLAVKIVKQLNFEKAAASEEEEDPSGKRRKITSYVGGILQNIFDHSQYPWPWLSYLDHLLEKAPEVLRDEDSVPLFRFLAESLPSSDPLSLPFLTRSSARLLNLCKTRNVIVNEKYHQELQTVLWATVLRCVAAPALVEIGLQLTIDIIPEWTSRDSARGLLDLFVEKKISVSKNALSALFSLISTDVFNSRDRILLLQWSLSGDQYSPETVFRLLLRKKLPLPEKHFQTELSQTDTELFLTTSSFEFFTPSSEPNSLEVNLIPKVVQEDREACDALLCCLVDRLGNVNSVSGLLSFSIFLCSLQSLLCKHNLTVSTRIEELLDQTISGLLPRLEEELKPSQNRNRVNMVLIRDFLHNYSKHLKEENIERISNISNLLMDILNIQHEKNCVGPNEKNILMNFPEVITVQTLCNIAELMPYDEKVHLYIKMLNFCSNKLTLTCSSGFKIAIELTKSINKSNILSAVLIKDIMKLQMKLLKRWFMFYNEVIQLLDLLYDTTVPIFKLDENNEIKPEIYRILSIFSNYISSKKYGPTIIIRYVSLLVHVIEVDKYGKDSIETCDGKLQPLLYFIEFLNSPFHEVRMKAAEYLSVLFSSEMCFRKSSCHQIAFNQVLKAVDKLFVIKDGKTSQDVKEEGLNRSCCALKVLLGLICSSYLWRRKALYHLFKLISTKNISHSLFGKVHNHLEKSLNLENVLSFLEQNLDYILWTWYEEYKDFQKFPYLFMNYESLPAFLKEYKTIVVAILLEHNDKNGFDLFCTALDCSSVEIAKSCFPEMIACLLPKLGGSDLKSAERMHSFILKLVDHNTLKKLLSSEIRKVLLAVYMKLNDSEHFRNIFDQSMPQLPSVIPLNISIDGVHSTLKYMQKTSPDPELCLLVLLSNEFPSHVQFIMHNLLANISIANTTEVRYLCFLQYISFCETLMSELVNIKRMAGFVIWHVTYALLNLVNSDLAVSACSFLFNFIENCFLNHARFIDYLLDTLYPTISALADKDSQSGEIALRIKNLLILKKSALPRIVAYLPLEETTANLEEELNIFIKRETPDLPALDRLTIQLMVRRNELNYLYDQLKSSYCFSEDCSKSVIHQLLSKLVSLATSSDTNIQKMAARCLGQIGPKNLNTLALQPESSTAPPSLAEKILSLLLPLLVHRDSEISEAASTAMTELLTTSDGFSALEKLSKIEKTYLIPFLPHDSDCSSSIVTSFNLVHLNWASCSKVLGCSAEGWAMWSGGNHSAWIRSVSSRLLAAFDRGVLPLLSPLAAKQAEIGEELLPYIVDIIIESADMKPEGLKVVQSNLSYFFKKHFELQNSIEKVEDDSLIYVNRKSVQCMLSIINFCRLKSAKCTENERSASLANLNVDLLHVAYAAQFCRAYFTSLLYAELWVESIRSEFNPVSFNYTPLDEVCKKIPESGRVLLNLLWEDYKELGERDSIEGCVRMQLGEPSARIRYFREMGLWQQLVAEAEVINDQEALSHGLLMSGLFTCASHLNHCSWDAGWRLSQWDMEGQMTGNEDFSSFHYAALKSALHSKDKDNAIGFLDSARSLVLRDLAHASLEVASCLYLPLAKLQLIYELENWCRGEDSEPDLPDSDWIHVEPILWQRGLLSADPQLWLSAARIASNNSSQLIAQRFLQNMKKMNLSKSLCDEIKAEEAQAHWNSGNLETAKYILRTILDVPEVNPALKAKCLLTYGTWMSETKSEGAKAIIEQYFEQAATLLESKPDKRLKAAECLAKFADSEYQRIHRYLQSPEFDMKKSQMDTFKKHLQGFYNIPQMKQTSEELKSLRIHKVNIEVDEAEIKAVSREYTSFLRLAVREYLYSLQFNETMSDKMFRFVSLWMANKNSGLRKELDQWLCIVPSYRFIPVFPQLAVRITPDDEHFSRTLRKLLYRCAEDHPHHCLWHLLALSNADFDKNTDSDTPPLPRVIGATNIINELEKSKTVGNIVTAMQELAKAYISLANIELPKNAKNCDYKIPRNEKLRNFKDINYVSCATINTPIKKNADYSNIIGITSFDDIYTLVGGINHPKRVKVLCSDGMKRFELVKGNDDPRQDALMQQVFSVLNTLLEGEKETSRRKLSVRTYKVVPLTQKSGVIEWCQNTETIGGFLASAHARHRPGDISQVECRTRLQNVVGQDPEEKLKVFLQICAEFKPVMRHFFFERFPTPVVWYEKRLAYTRSVATNSMIGYIMGIGDRHVHNILIDKESAELIHIDFGISFELGRILPTPETVPFRLTRDIEDGMGIAGVEGVFRRCSEETMKVLRKRSEPVLTTLEMLLYDPLYSWTVKPRSDQSQQSIPDMSTEETNKLAERFLLRLKLKLQGREEGEASSIEGQVRNLIQEAKDPKNLCRLYRGWQAFF